MRRVMIILLSLMLCGCEQMAKDVSSLLVSEEEAAPVTTNTTRGVYTASKETTTSPIATSSDSETRKVKTTYEPKDTTVPETIMVTTYAVSESTTAVESHEEVKTTVVTVWNDEDQVYDTSVATITDTVNSVVTEPEVTYDYTPIYDQVTNMGYEAFQRINEYRKEKDLEEYELDVSLTLAANLRAREVAEVLSHTRPDYSSFSTVFDEFGVSYNENAAESVGVGYATANAMCYKWYQTSSDRKYMLDETYHFDKVGVGYYYYAGKSYWVALYIRS